MRGRKVCGEAHPSSVWNPGRATCVADCRREGHEGAGFEECKVTNGVFTHSQRDLRTVAHVDDFLVSGELHDLLCFRNQLHEKYELKVQVAGWGWEDDKGSSFLVRVIRLTPTGIELEGDDTHMWDCLKRNGV